VLKHDKIAVPLINRYSLNLGQAGGMASKKPGNVTLKPLTSENNSE